VAATKPPINREDQKILSLVRVNGTASSRNLAGLLPGERKEGMRAIPRQITDPKKSPESIGISTRMTALTIEGTLIGVTSF
jgi:hypothetical protein